MFLFCRSIHRAVILRRAAILHREVTLHKEVIPHREDILHREVTLRRVDIHLEPDTQAEIVSSLFQQIQQSLSVKFIMYNCTCRQN